MKNNLIILFISYVFFCSFAQAQTFKFLTKNLEILENGNLINAKDGKAFSLDGDLEINADKFEYIKDLDILKSFGSGLAIIKSKNLEIEFENAIFDQKNSTIKANGNVKINQIDKNFIIETDEITYDQKFHLIISDTKTVLKDNLQNTYIADNFLFEINKNLLKVENLNFKDIDDNTLKTQLAYINTETGKLFGKDVNINLSNTYLKNENEPRLKGNSVSNDNKNTEVTKGIFTNCKKRDGCPPWEMTAEKIRHDKKGKTIYYNNAFLHVYDVPVMYFPKFFHPDPTVKRRSGFLTPRIKSSNNSDGYLNTPYFLAIAENKDATFSPRLYNGDKILLQTEYRQVNSKTQHNADFSFFAEKNKNSKHLFYEYDKNINYKNFEDGLIDLVIQKTSDDTYLRTNKLKSELVKDENILENSLSLNLYSNDMSIDFNTTAYEDLNKEKSDRFEYILPKINLVKRVNYDGILNGDFTLKSKGLGRNYNTNVYETTNINDLIFDSYPKITTLGFYNNYEFIIKNSNTNGEKSKKYKDDENYYLSSLFQYNSSLPLIKENDDYQNVLKPRLSLRLAPTHTKDNREGTQRVDVNNIYSLTRTTGDDTTEGGVSMAYGSDYSIFNKEKSRDILNLKLANNLRFERNEDLPGNSQMGQKTSSVFGEISYSPNEILTTKYSTSVKNNLADINYENLVTEFKINNLVTTFDYLNENFSFSDMSYLTNTTTYSVNDYNSLSFSTRENKTANLTEYYNLMYQYKNDCLAASIEYNKDFYNDRDIKPEENIFFKLTIIPFDKVSSPNLKN
ncbi:hypothetical protein N9341_00470 [Candidatus Pelagibacter sp.]|nr:hypothetical protein [Candidatus Pelagibacter sp.]